MSSSLGNIKVKQIILILSPQYGNSALMLAIWQSHTYTVMELMKAGANLDIQDKVE